ncbi:DUF3892 domain-containing protein [Aliamphritea spongicola]|uniref:DUF3892 domain-containing protein n=1 Tax=Aliamphritea spongicola TaxID=707589 RepID=UPI00196B0164|nr:DUF3892 domain-containing protein [Aliamphritea spongicola]MBN3563183.1 DUF3892 domain-containing protein [Aliamphritea spongicola]
MAKASSISGNADGVNGENQSYTVQGRGVVSRSQLVREVNNGSHQGVHTVDVNGVEYVRANPNRCQSDNID